MERARMARPSVGQCEMRHATLRDAYTIIGVDPDATDFEVKRAFRERVKQTHPDLNLGKKADDEFLQLVQAYRQTTVGRMPEQPIVEPPKPLRERLLRGLAKNKWKILAAGTLVVALYIRAEPPAEEPVTPDKAERPKAVAQVQVPQNVEPVWVKKSAAGSPLIGVPGTKTVFATALPHNEPQLPYALRGAIAEERPTKTADRGGVLDKSVTGTLPEATPANGDSAEPAASPAFVGIMPKRRPKHLGEAKKHHHSLSKPTLAGETKDAPTTPNAPSTPAKPEPSLLGQLLGLH